MARLLLGVSGGIAAYKALEFARLAVKAGHAVRVLQTPASLAFVGTASFAAISGAPVLVDEFDHDPARGAFPDQRPPAHDPISHLELVANADAFLIAPASANTIAKLAHGLADNMVCSAALSARCPLIVAPAMNDRMYDHPATRANLDLLRARGTVVLEPEVGQLASKGEWGVGRLPDPAALLRTVEALVEAGAPRPLDGLGVLVTAGGTREPIDGVRYVGNRSSGRMGFALAVEAARRGADVTVIAANVTLARDPRITYLDVESAAELAAACSAHFPNCDVLLMVAAVADYRPLAPVASKLDKRAAAAFALELERTTDVLSALAEHRRPDQTLVGFAAEYGAGGLRRGRAKLTRKGLDAIVVNDVARTDIGFDSELNEVTIVTADGEHHVALASKPEIARAILDDLELIRRQQPVKRQPLGRDADTIE